MKSFGLIGKTLKHSFSQKYFTEKWESEKLSGLTYHLFELTQISEFVDLIKKTENLSGLNVTIPYKEQVIPFLDHLDERARRIGAVNVIKFDGGTLTGYNSDYYGFRTSVENWAGDDLKSIKALVLGTGGASKAVLVALEDMGIPYLLVSRQAREGVVSYDEVRDQALLTTHKLVINTTPLGMYPNITSKPDLDYQKVTSEHYFFDAVYNPEETAFMKAALSAGGKALNGLEMLHLQAEKSWEIWNQ